MRTLPLVVLTILAAASATAQPRVYTVPFASTGNAVELEVAGLDGAPAEVAVVTAPDWLAFAARAIRVEGDAPVARLAFDVVREAPVGEPAEVTFEVRSGGAVVATHTVRLTVDAPAALALAAPFPNPSRGTATIPYQLPEAGQVTVDVLDVLGRRVLTLASGEKPAGGHTARVDTSVLASGSYVVRLVVEGADGRVTRQARRLSVAR